MDPKLNEMIDEFAAALRDKLAYTSGFRSGWDDPNFSYDNCIELVVDQTESYNCDPIDIAAYAAFAWSKL